MALPTLKYICNYIKSLHHVLFGDKTTYLEMRTMHYFVHDEFFMNVGLCLNFGRCFSHRIWKVNEGILGTYFHSVRYTDRHFDSGIFLLNGKHQKDRG